MLDIVQLLEFEICRSCNLGREHTACPNLSPERYSLLDSSRPMTDEQIVSCAIQAYEDLAFSGLVGWIYYNEPTLVSGRMFALMREIKLKTSRARFILWTNGMFIPPACEEYEQFEQIVISGYNEKSMLGAKRLASRGIPFNFYPLPSLDSRMQEKSPEYPNAPCYRPFVEFILDHYGNHHLCCYDWRGRGSLGNVHNVPFAELVCRWRETLPTICGRSMSEWAPAVCRTCGYRWPRIQRHDDAIVNRALKYVREISKRV
jgi:hypothetical protein